jgi:hypothetical protein
LVGVRAGFLGVGATRRSHNKMRNRGETPLPHGRRSYKIRDRGRKPPPPG